MQCIKVATIFIDVYQSKAKRGYHVSGGAVFSD